MGRIRSRSVRRRKEEEEEREEVILNFSYTSYIILVLERPLDLFESLIEMVSVGIGYFDDSVT